LVMLNALLIWFRKVPFTCSYFPGKMSMAAIAGVFTVTFYLYVFTMSRLEQRWIEAPAGLVLYFVLCGAALYGLRLLEDRELRIDDVSIYDAQRDPVVRSLELG